MSKILRSYFRRFEARQRFFAGLQGTCRVLDLGCGPGDNGVALKELHPDIDIHGVDLLPAGAVRDFYSYSVVDLDRGVLPYPDGYFDAVLFTHVIEHLRSPLQLGKEINRVMKQGALIYVETPNWTTAFVPSFGFHREQHNPFNFYDDPTHVKPWTKHGLFEFLYQSCNVNVIKTRTRRNFLRLPFDIPIFLLGLLTGNRSYTVTSFWNLYGWCIYAVGAKR